MLHVLRLTAAFFRHVTGYTTIIHQPQTVGPLPLSQNIARCVYACALLATLYNSQRYSVHVCHFHHEYIEETATKTLQSTYGSDWKCHGRGVGTAARSRHHYFLRGAHRDSTAHHCNSGNHQLRLAKYNVFQNSAICSLVIISYG